MGLRNKSFNTIDFAVTGWMARNGLPLLRISIGIIFFWFGILKFFEGLRPAEDLAIRTISVLTFHVLPAMSILGNLKGICAGAGSIPGKMSE